MNHYQKDILNNLSKAKSSIQVAVSWVTDPKLIDSLIRKAKERIRVEVIVSADEWNVLRYDQFQKLKCEGALILKYGPSEIDKPEFMHCKFCIIDRGLTIDGSYNWTKNAQNNQEQLRVDDNKEWVSRLISKFNDMRINSVDYFSGISNPKQIIDKLVLLENKKLQPSSPVRKLYEEKLKTSDLITSNNARTDRNGNITALNTKTDSTYLKTTKNRKHRFYGDNNWFAKFFQNQNKVSSQYSKIVYQKYHLEKQFDIFKYKSKNNRLVCTGTLAPKNCNNYNIRLEYQPKKTPKIFISSPTIEPNPEIHMYKDGSLCLFYPPDLKWKDNLKIADYFIPWVAEWIIFYELWEITGTWLGPEAPHSLPEN